jgi:hypothetical protein
VLAGGDHLSQHAQRRPQRQVSPQEQGLVWFTLGQGQKLCCSFTRRLELHPDKMNIPQPRQYPEEVRGFADLLTELLRPGSGSLCGEYFQRLG